MQKYYQTLAFSLYKVIDYIVGYAGYISFREGSNNLFLRRENREIIERRWISDNLRDIVDYKLYFVLLAKFYFLERLEEESLRYCLLLKL